MNKILERSSPYLILTLPEIQECIKHLSDSKIKDCILAKSGLSTTNYIVTLDNGRKLVLRVYKDPSSPQGRKEIKLSSLLADFSIIPKIHCFKPIASKGISYSLLDFIDGTLLSEITNKDRDILKLVYFEIGRLLAQLKNIKFPSHGLLNENLEVSTIKTDISGFHPVTNFVIDCLNNKNFIKNAGLILKKEIQDLVLQQDLILQNIPQENHLVHGDFKIENILVNTRKDGQIHLVGILDWEHARSDTSYGDIATLFRGDYDKESIFKLAFLEGYESGGAKLIKNWDKACKLIDLVNLCSFLCSDNNRPMLYSFVTSHLINTISYFNGR